MSNSPAQLHTPLWHGRLARVSDAELKRIADTRCPLSSTSPTWAGRPCHKEARARRGFTFTEILFAVLILGIGFILVAAIFPVALKQTQATSEETAAATIAKGGVAYLEKYPTQSYWYAPTGATAPDAFVHPIGPANVPGEPIPTNTTLWGLLGSNFILPSDPRYAWVPMYRQIPNQVAGQSYVQLIVIGVQARNRGIYDSADLATRADGSATLQARPLTATFTANSTGGTVAFTAIASEPNNIQCLSDGAFVVVANDSTGVTNGWVYRLGTGMGNNTWGLAPGNDLPNTNPAPPVPGGGNAVTVLVVGSGYPDATTGNPTPPTPPTPWYSGPCQDVAVYTTFLTVH